MIYQNNNNNCQITPKIESLVACAMPDIPSKFQKDPSITFRVILLTDRQTNKQTNKNRQKHNLLGEGNYKSYNTIVTRLLQSKCKKNCMYIQNHSLKL